MNVRQFDDASRARTWRRVVATEVLAHPTLWWPALVAVARFAPRGWWRRPPFLPTPDERYWRFRMETAYGDADAPVDPDDLLEALRWTRRSRRARR